MPFYKYTELARLTRLSATTPPLALEFDAPGQKASWKRSNQQDAVAGYLMVTIPAFKALPQPRL